MQTSEVEKIHQPAESHSDRAAVAAQAQWLEWMHDIFPDAHALFLFRIHPNQTVSRCASSPSSSTPGEPIVNAVLSTVHRQKPLYARLGSANHVLAVPLLEGSSKIQFVLIIVTSSLSQVQQNTATKLTQWAAMRLYSEATASTIAESELAPDATLANAMMQSLDRHGSLNGLAFTLVNKLSSLCGCVRVSLGHYDGEKLHLVAMSGQSKIDDRRKIARQLCALMQETLECRRGLYPSDDDEVKPSFQSYFKSQGEHPLLSFVMPGSHADEFVLVLERDAGGAFVQAQADAIEQSVQNLAALLSVSFERQLPARTKLRRSVQRKLAAFSEFSQWSVRQIFAATACFALLLSFIIPVTHRVSADAYIEASDRQVLVSAQDGFILSAHARAGEIVEEGDLLATLDAKNLNLAAEKWRSEKAKNQQEYAQALAIHDRSELSRLRADVQRIDAEISLIEQQLSRSEVRAPFKGVLLHGDWTQSLGAPVATGDVLFEIASAEKYRLVLEVDEHDIGYIQPDQLAQLRMASLPTSVWEAELGDVLPVAVSEKGHSAFRVPANISGDATALRPGMEGIGKVSVGKRSMFWVYSHSLFDRIRYFAWKVGLI